MSYQLVEKRTSSRLGQAVFALDRWLRRRCGIYEYCQNPNCILRLQACAAPRDLRLRDGTVVHSGEPALRLHLWNEHLPRMARGGPSMRWARRVSRDVEHSLRELAQYLERRPELNGINVLFGDMNLATARQTRQFRRIVVRLGFELSPEQPRRSVLRHVGETIFVLLLVIATNPMGLRRALRGYQSRVYLSRAALLTGYCATAPLPWRPDPSALKTGA